MEFHKGTTFSPCSYRKMDRHTDAKPHPFNGPHITLQTYHVRALYHCPIYGWPHIGQQDKTQPICPKMHPFHSVPGSIQVHYLAEVLIKCHLVKPYYSCIIRDFKIHRIGTFSHMVTVTGTSFRLHSTTAPPAICRWQLQNNIKNIIITGQEINTHKINKCITSSDL